MLGAFFGSFRGYAGDISPAGALDLVATDGNTYLIDLRSAREKVTFLHMLNSMGSLYALLDTSFKISH